MTTTGVVFHELEVATVAPLTDDAVAVTLAVPAELSDEFRYEPGQHITIRKVIGGEDVRRSYSLCADANQGTVRVGIKRLDGGVFSTWATTELRSGDVLEVMRPVGEFTIPAIDGPAHLCAIVAGSGITPVLSMLTTTLAADPERRWTVVYGNRTARSVMFLEELEALKDRYADRLQLIHVLSREDTGLPITSGRIDRERLELLCSSLINPKTIDHWFLCGPYEMVMTAREFLAERGVDEATVHDELFFAGPPDPATAQPPADDEPGSVALEFTLEGRASSTRMMPETSVLDAAIAVRAELPFSCKGGMCATCKARVVEGSVTMDKNYALVDADLEAGFVLTCQSHPTSDRLVVDYDAR